MTTSDAKQADPPRASGSGTRLLPAVAKNVLVAALLGGFLLALETGYFSADRTLRADWDKLEHLKTKGKPRAVYETRFERNLLDGSVAADASGRWDYYNGAKQDTARVDNGALILTYTQPWIGAYLNLLRFEPRGVYRIRFEASVEGEPAAILVRNRQLDLMRQSIPVTGKEFKEFTAEFVAPGGRWDLVRIVLIPDNKGKPRGRMTVRAFRVERLEG